MTNQEAFDKVARHLLAQGATSMNDTDTCLYRGPNGLMCAVGCLIPDDEYSEDMEGQSVSVLLNWRRAPAAIRHLGTDLLADLQRLHDDEPPEWWGAELAKVADRHGLSGDVLREVAR